MPNWTDESGFSWFNKLRCKRCLEIFEYNEVGEVSVHECLGGYSTSKTVDGVSHYPVPAEPPVFVKKKSRKRNR